MRQIQTVLHGVNPIYFFFIGGCIDFSIEKYHRLLINNYNNKVWYKII